MRCCTALHVLSCHSISCVIIYSFARDPVVRGARSFSFRVCNFVKLTPQDPVKHVAFRGRFRARKNATGLRFAQNQNASKTSSAFVLQNKFGQNQANCSKKRGKFALLESA